MMPLDDIIDNVSERLFEHAKRVLASAEAARSAVGYFSVYGLTPVSNKLANARKEL